MKHLPKHLQPRWRYLAVGIEAWPDADFDRGAFQRDLWYAAQNLYGDTGSAEADLTVLSFHFADGDGETVVRAHRGTEDRARAAVAALDRVATDTAANRSSMHQDVVAGRRTEVDAIYGAVTERAARHEVAAPTCRTLSALLRAWERGRGLRGEK